METIKWNNYEWELQERWGQLHPDRPVCWYDGEMVSIENDILLLKTCKKQKEFYIDNKLYTSYLGCGLVSNTTKFEHGYFEAEIKLPDGPYLWPAFWMWAWESWPPEIDIFEGKTGKCGTYFNWKLSLWDINSNVHYNDINEQHAQIGGKTHFYSTKNPTKNYIKYSCIWAPDRIEIFYNDRCVRTIKDKYILKRFEGKTMNVIINNYSSIWTDITEQQLADFKETTMYVKNFRYEKL
jgi:beta-glucanase (GH16 family)